MADEVSRRRRRALLVPLLGLGVAAWVVGRRLAERTDLDDGWHQLPPATWPTAGRHEAVVAARPPAPAPEPAPPVPPAAPAPPAPPPAPRPAPPAAMAPSPGQAPRPSTPPVPTPPVPAPPVPAPPPPAAAPSPEPPAPPAPAPPKFAPPKPGPAARPAPTPKPAPPKPGPAAKPAPVVGQPDRAVPTTTPTTTTVAGPLRALSDGSSPDSTYTVKGKTATKVFHAPGGAYYTRTRADVWFRTADDARAAGFTERGPRRHR